MGGTHSKQLKEKAAETKANPLSWNFANIHRTGSFKLTLSYLLFVDTRNIKSKNTFEQWWEYFTLRKNYMFSDKVVPSYIGAYRNILDKVKPLFSAKTTTDLPVGEISLCFSYWKHTLVTYCNPSSMSIRVVVALEARLLVWAVFTDIFLYLLLKYFRLVLSEECCVTRMTCWQTQEI